MGSHDNVEAGIIPRLCNALFERIALDKNNMACQVNFDDQFVFLIPFKMESIKYSLYNFKWIAILLCINTDLRSKMRNFYF